MKDLSFHITDIIQNSVRAGATAITLEITEQHDIIRLRIADNGCGMDAETVNSLRNPFYTTRTTRKVGLGVPFLIQNVEQTGGEVIITSAIGEGTEVTAVFHASSIDCPPWGDLAGTVAMTITGNPDTDITFRYLSDKEPFELTTVDVKEAMEGIPLSHPKIMLLLKEMIGIHISDSSNTEENA